MDSTMGKDRNSRGASLGGVPWLVSPGWCPWRVRSPGWHQAVFALLSFASSWITQDRGSASGLGKMGSFSPKDHFLLCCRCSNIAVPREKHLYTMASFDEFLKGFRVTSGNSQLLFPIPDCSLDFQNIPGFLSALRKG